MVSFQSLLAAAPLLGLALAQQKIAFTSTPAVAVAGESYNITWGGGNEAPVTLTLRRGNPLNLNTVSTIADNVRESYYIWMVPSSLASGSDYALQITQGLADINYSGLFSVSSASSNGTSSSSSSTSSMMSMTGVYNSSMSMTAPASAQGTGTTMSRNTTFSSASLTSSRTAANTFGAMSSTTSSSRTSSATSTASTTSAPTNDAPVKMGSSAALILGIVAAMMLH